MALYESVRNDIESGDIIAFKVSEHAPFFSRILQIGTGKKIYHIGIAVWMESSEGQKRLFIVEASRGNRQMVPLSLYSKETMDVYPCPIEFSKIAPSLIEPIGNVKYAYKDLLSIWLRESFGIRIGNFPGEVCSGMVVNIFKNSGYDLGPEISSPYSIVKHLEDNGIQKKIEIK